MTGDADADSLLHLEGCEGERLADVQTGTSSGGEQQRTRVLVCAKAGTSNVGKLQRLRDTVKRVEANPDLSADEKNRVVTALNAAIAALPAQE